MENPIEELRCGEPVLGIVPFDLGEIPESNPNHEFWEAQAERMLQNGALVIEADPKRYRAEVEMIQTMLKQMAEVLNG
jgi:hypothetical protein